MQEKTLVEELEEVSTQLDALLRLAAEATGPRLSPACPK
jgi:hypothetical protein